MLVLTRKKGEEIIILGNIKITVAEIKNGRVKLAIDAPKSVSVNRAEIMSKVKEFNLKASGEENAEILSAQIELKSLLESKVRLGSSDKEYEGSREASQ